MSLNQPPLFAHAKIFQRAIGASPAILVATRFPTGLPERPAPRHEKPVDSIRSGIAHAAPPSAFAIGDLPQRFVPVQINARAARPERTGRCSARFLCFRVSSQHPAKLMDDLAGPSDLGARLFEDFLGQWLATAIADFQQAL